MYLSIRDSAFKTHLPLEELIWALEKVAWNDAIIGLRVHGSWMLGSKIIFHISCMLNHVTYPSNKNQDD